MKENLAHEMWHYLNECSPLYPDNRHVLLHEKLTSYAGLFAYEGESQRYYTTKCIVLVLQQFGVQLHLPDKYGTPEHTSEMSAMVVSDSHLYKGAVLRFSPTKNGDVGVIVFVGHESFASDKKLYIPLFLDEIPPSKTKKVSLNKTRRMSLNGVRNLLAFVEENILVHLRKDPRRYLPDRVLPQDKPSKLVGLGLRG